ncbi:MAG: MerR family transcriptional regulator [Anaerolineae bacterium]
MRPVYTIGTAAEILGIHPRTLRLYEEGGLLRPARKKNRRFYSATDLEWISCIRYLIHEKGLNQEGLRRLLALIPCWEIKGCAENERNRCIIWANRNRPCWDWARRIDNDTRNCHACEVYLTAWSRVMDPDEHEIAIRYGLAG